MNQRIALVSIVQNITPKVFKIYHEAELYCPLRALAIIACLGQGQVLFLVLRRGTSLCV